LIISHRISESSKAQAEKKRGWGKTKFGAKKKKKNSEKTIRKNGTDKN